MSLQRQFIALLVTLVSSVFIANELYAEESAQERITSTPARVDIPERAPLTTVEQNATRTPTRTPTQIGPAILEARTEANVRAGPSTEAELVGTIRSGEVYNVVGRYFRWLQFQFNPALNGGIGWVFDELVTITGDESAIRVLDDADLNSLPVVDDAAVRATETAVAITLTPGGLLTATAGARILPAPSGLNQNNPAAGIGESGDSSSSVLPTFTFPPDVVAVAPTEPRAGAGRSDEANENGNGVRNAVEGGVAPIVPIAIFGGLGLLGLAVTILRR